MIMIQDFDVNIIYLKLMKKQKERGRERKETTKWKIIIIEELLKNLPSRLYTDWKTTKHSLHLNRFNDDDDVIYYIRHIEYMLLSF